MQLIRCTAKLLKELKQDPVTSVKPIRNMVGGWHANLLRIERTPLYELNARLNRTPFSAIGYSCPIDRLNELLHLKTGNE